jgi:hypothetical protein
LRDETIAISDIEKIPFATVKAATIASSVRAELIRDETTTSVMACRPGKKRAIAQRGQIYTVILLLLIPSCPDVAPALPLAWGDRGGPGDQGRSFLRHGWREIDQP